MVFEFTVEDILLLMPRFPGMAPHYDCSTSKTISEFSPEWSS